MAHRGNGAAGSIDETKGAKEKRQSERHSVLELGMLWSSAGESSARLGPAMITNVSIGGVQIHTKHAIKANETVVLELGTNEGPVFIPGDIRYSKNGHSEGSYTLGVRFQPETKADRQALAQYVLNLRDQILVSDLSF